ncbi:MAG: type II secretion system protein GspK [Verrucomicrobiales bacterium]|nr:type II secretion system protein GspK [Verrucomicrobiales bacterium]
MVYAGRAGERGMALLLVLASVIILALIVGGLWEASEPGWEESSLRRAEYQAGMLAESGLVVAMHPEIEPGDAALRFRFDENRDYEVLITSEGARIPVNSLTEAPWRDATTELFVSWGMDAASASRAVDSLADWIDEDGEVLSNGAENAFYAGLQHPEYPLNEPFTSLEQMLFVAGMDVVARKQPLWRDYFTIFSDGLVDLNAASWEVVSAITGATYDSALNFVSVRNGDDGIAGTIDDYVFDDVGEVQAVLGISDSEWGEISSLVSLVPGIRRIESTGRIGEFRETRVILARESGNEFTVLARFRNGG